MVNLWFTDKDLRYCWSEVKDVFWEEFERRMRRVKLITNILRRLDFECHARSDFLNAAVSYKDAQTITDNLYVLGRLTIMTKQLDMVLSNDDVAEWYTKDFIKRLGLSSVDKDQD